MSSFSRPAKLSFNDFDAVGVDLDHTLCKYKLDNTFPLIYKSLAEAVVSRKGYSAELLEPFDKDKDFCTKGLVFDAKKGNFLKLSREGDILRASHGTTPLCKAEVCEIYGSQARWEHFDFLKDTLKQTGRKRISINLSITTSFVCTVLYCIKKHPLSIGSPGGHFIQKCNYGNFDIVLPW
nr:5'-nucleotidase domain-containing protein 1-like [Lytechinus pictus]